ncbi:hypothetical protein J4467_01745 [Candidatus Woesearchaeota archaeon]|nr:hypothetical protein [Candidatus Woesearchaeota archaeon]
MVFSVAFKEDKVIEESFEKFTKEFEEFYNIREAYSKPQIFILENRESVNQMLKRITPDWLVGWAERKNVYILEKSAFVKEINDEDYAKLIKHELNHCYFYMVSNYCDKPRWLFEGIAIYLSGQLDKRLKPDVYKNFLNYYDNSDDNVYKESGFAVEFLIKYYGKPKFLELIRGLKYIASKEKFVLLFKEVYGFDLKYDNFKV